MIGYIDEASRNTLRQFMTGNEFAEIHLPRKDRELGPVARLKKGTMNRRCTDWLPDPENETRERRFHYTKGWRYRRVAP